jgi:phosphoribosylformimino-5-aminoimidazole carboxamide ribotide isomerase
MFPGRIVLGIDARDGRVALDGWAETSVLAAAELAARFEGAGAAAIIFTDIGRDGTLTGLAIEATVALAAGLATPVIASGGANSLADLVALRMAAARLRSGAIEGVVVGRALYDGRIDPVAARARLAAA